MGRRSAESVQSNEAYVCTDRPDRNDTISFSFKQTLLTASYTLSVKLSYFTACHTWRKNWVNCAVLTGNSEGLRNGLSSRLSHTELGSSLRESQSFLSLPVDTKMASSQRTQPQQPFLAIHSADEHRMIYLYSFSNTTSYSTFYAFFSYLRVALWPMWLANSKRQSCFYPS
jgi:hypothetical protein